MINQILLRYLFIYIYVIIGVVIEVVNHNEKITSNFEEEKCFICICI